MKKLLHLIRAFVYRILAIYKRIRLVGVFIRHKSRYINEESFYPEKEHKTRREITKDFLSHIIKYGEIDDSYFALGIDVKGVNYDDYFSYGQYMSRRDKLNLTQPVNYVCLLRNKSLFADLGSFWGFPVVRDVAKYTKGVLMDTSYVSLEELFGDRKHVFVKPIDAKKGEGVYSIDEEGSDFVVNGNPKTQTELIGLMRELSNEHELIIQDKVVQHQAISVLHKESVNTLRVVTINHLHSSSPNDVVYVGAELRVGCGKNRTDNISAGGIKIGVNEDGKLQKFGFYRKPHGTKATLHPDSKIVFENYAIPFFVETIGMCKSFHAKLKEIHLIGWDVAITENGPLFIEGNDSCGTDFQVMNGPMKEFYSKYLPVSK